MTMEEIDSIESTRSHGSTAISRLSLFKNSIFFGNNDIKTALLFLDLLMKMALIFL